MKDFIRNTWRLIIAAPTDPAGYVRQLMAVCAILLLLALAIGLPWSLWWLHESGDLAMETAATVQGQGEFALYGPGIAQDIQAYKLTLYAKKRPGIVLLGSDGAMQFQQDWFRTPFLNMSHTCDNLTELRSTLEQLLEIHRPEVVLIALDFWWFVGAGKYAPVIGNHLAWQLPLFWLLKGEVSLREFFAPVSGLFGDGFRRDRFGLRAQQTSDGFGPDGAWHPTGLATGIHPPTDYQFARTLADIELAKGQFTLASAVHPSRLEAFAEIWCMLKARGIEPYIFLPPLAPQAFDAVEARRNYYPHLFNLPAELEKMGIPVTSFSNPRILPSSSCEFLNGTQGGEVTAARVLRHLADTWPQLLHYVNMEKLDIIIRDWAEHTMIPDARITELPETDFHDLGCPRTTS